MNHYFEREVKHLEYVEQRKKIREQEKKEMELELEKKKVVSEISETKAVAFFKPQWKYVYLAYSTVCMGKLWLSTFFSYSHDSQEGISLIS